MFNHYRSFWKYGEVKKKKTKVNSHIPLAQETLLITIAAYFLPVFFFNPFLES